MKEVIQIEITIPELKNIVEEALRSELANLSNNEPRQSLEVYLTREETSKLLKISLPTLDDYTRRGVIEGYRIGTLIRYKKAEVESSLKLIPTIKYKRITKYKI